MAAKNTFKKAATAGKRAKRDAVRGTKRVDKTTGDVVKGAGAKKTFSGKVKAVAKAGKDVNIDLESRDILREVNREAKAGFVGDQYVGKAAESGRQRIDREKADARRVMMRERADRWASQIKSGQSKISDVPESLRPYVRDAMKEAPAAPAKKTAAPKKTAAKPTSGVKSPAEIKADMDKAAKNPKAPKPEKKAAPSKPKTATAAPASSKPKASATAPSAKSEKPKTETKPKVTKPAADKKAKPKFEQKPKAAAAPKSEPKAKTTKPKASAVKAPEMTPAMKKATEALKVAGKLKGPVAMAGKAARFAANPYVAVASLVAPSVIGGLKKLGQGMQEQAKKPVPSTSSAKAETALAKRLGNKSRTAPAAAKTAKPTTSKVNTQKPADRGYDKGASSAANVVRGTAMKPAGTSTSVTVKKGDSLWAIAQANKTSVDALLKANPVLAKRKAEGKTVLFTNTKVRIPKK